MMDKNLTFIVQNSFWLKETKQICCEASAWGKLSNSYFPPMAINVQAAMAEISQ